MLRHLLYSVLEMAGHQHPGYEDLRAHGWLTWAELEEQAGGGSLSRRWVRLLRESGVWPATLPRPVVVPRAGRGGDALYHPDVAAFLRDAAALRPYGHFRGQRHSIGRTARPLAALRLLLAARGWEYGSDVLCSDVVAVVAQFRALAGTPTWTTDRLGAWLFTGTTAPGRKRAAYWSAKTRDLMAWLSLLAGRSIRDDVWNGQRHLPPFSRIIRSIEQADHAVLKAWIIAFRPLVDTWCFPSPEPQTIDEILAKLSEPPPPVDEIKRGNIATRVFQLLNWGLEYTYRTRPGDVDRWEGNRKRQGHRLPQPTTHGRYMWRRARLYDLSTGKVIYEVPMDRSLYYPDNPEEVVARLFKYAGVFVALGIATHAPARTDPVAPLPEGRPLPPPWGLCRYCNVPLRAASINNQPRVWCPQCFVEVYELIPVLTRYNERRKRFELITL
jgi:hypothetical protein